jgi:pseudouridine synthase
MAIERLQKILSRAGIASRRKAEEMIIEGRVKVNGKIVKIGARADADRDHIKVDGKLIKTGVSRKSYFLAFKPRNMLTSLADPRGRPTIADLLSASKIRVRVFPVGRLDWNADGLMLLTNDGELAHRVMHPRTHVPKVYRVKVMGHPLEETVRRLRRGVRIGKNTTTLPARVTLERRTEKCSWFYVTLTEGRHHQIKKMFERVRHPVLAIRRVALGPLRLGRLRPGDVRALTPTEIKRLRDAVRL